MSKGKHESFERFSFAGRRTRHRLALVASAAALWVLAAPCPAETVSILKETSEGAFPSGSWTIYGSPSWDDTSYRAASGSWSCYCADTGISPPGPYAADMAAWMVYGPFDLSDAVSASATFWYWLDSEQDFDYLKWGSSNDGSLFQLYATSGFSSGWSSQAYNFADAGHLGEPQVWFAIKFDSDSSAQYEGAYVDDILVQKIIPIIDDAYEPNNMPPSEVYDLGSYEQVWLSTIAGPGIQADDDWYEIYVTPNYNNVVVDLSFADADGDIDLGLYDASLNLIAGSYSVTDDEHLDVVVDSAGGVYYMRVFYGDAGNTYDLWWDDLQPPVAWDDPNLVATCSSSTRIDLQWDDVAGGAYGYTLYTATQPDWSDKTWVFLPAGTISRAATGLTPGTRYYFALNVSTAPEERLSEVSAAAIPTNLTATASSSTRIDVTWGDTGMGKSYTLYVATQPDYSDKTWVFLAAGTTSHSFTALSPGTTYYFALNPTNDYYGNEYRLDEDSEQALVSGCDLVITEMTHSPASPEVGQTVIFTVTVKNQGSVDAGGFWIDFWSDRSSSPTETDLDYDGFAQVTLLAAGGSTTASVFVDASANGSFTAWAYADHDPDQVTESNESNNAGPSGGHAWSVGNTGGDIVGPLGNGCSAGGGASSLPVMVAILFVLRRRRAVAGRRG